MVFSIRKLFALASGSIKRRLYLLTCIVALILILMALVFQWAGNTLTMITAIARFERTHTVSRLEAIVFLHKFNESRNPADLESFARKWKITQSYNKVYGDLLTMRTTKSRKEFADIVHQTFAEADENTAEIVANRMNILYWHPIIIELSEIARHANEQGVRMEKQVRILINADSPRKTREAFLEIDRIESAFQELENRFSYQSGVLASQIAFIVNLLSGGMFLLSVGITSILAYLTIRSITVPMGRFISYSKEVAEGNLSAEIPEINGTELLALNDSMSIMLNLNNRLKNEVDEKIQAEDALKRSNAFLSSIIESPKNIDILSLDQTGRYTAFNDNHKMTMKKLYNADIAGGMSIFECITLDEERKQAIESFVRAVGGEHFSTVQQYGPAGNRCSFEISYSPIFDKTTGVPHGVTLFKVDITERVKLEQMLLQAQKMEAIGTLAGGIAHDFNNILGGIVGYAQMAAYDIPPEQKTYHYLEQVLAASYRARELVQQILSFSRQTEIEKRPLRLDIIAKEVVKLLRASLPSTIDIALNIQSQGLIINANPTHIHQILMNLCTNAKHAIGEQNGTLSITLNASKPDDSKLFPGFDFYTRNYAIITVSDTGCGIAPSLISRIFEPYFTTKEQDKGTGLGLAVVHKIISDHNGAIHVESVLGQGSSFYIALPRYEGPDEAAAVKELKLVMGSGSILFVDDEKILTEMGKEMLERLGYRVTAFNAPEEALRDFSENPDSFDLLITDMTMPKLTGEMLATKIHQIRPDLPVILCTGFSESINGERAAAAGISTILLKPLIMERFSMTIHQVLDRKGDQKTAGS